MKEEQLEMDLLGLKLRIRNFILKQILIAIGHILWGIVLLIFVPFDLILRLFGRKGFFHKQEENMPLCVNRTSFGKR